MCVSHSLGPVGGGLRVTLAALWRAQHLPFSALVKRDHGLYDTICEADINTKRKISPLEDNETVSLGTFCLIFGVKQSQVFITCSFLLPHCVSVESVCELTLREHAGHVDAPERRDGGEVRFAPRCGVKVPFQRLGEHGSPVV